MGNISSRHKIEIVLGGVGITATAIITILLRLNHNYRKKILDLQNTLCKPQIPSMFNMMPEDKPRPKQSQEIFKVVVTGGPCAGKSSSMKKISEVFTQRGFRVLGVPEVPTMIVEAGGMILMSKFNLAERVKFQGLLMRFQMYAQDYFYTLAQMSNMPAIVVCDRGVIDPHAYISEEEFQTILDQQKWTWVTLRDRRYDRVIFLSSAANGAQKFYTLDNNVARSQGIELARELDKKTLDSWVGHPHLTIVPNVSGEDFKDKMQRTVEAVQKTVGIELKNMSYLKLLIQEPKYPSDLKTVTAEIEETFLVNENPEFQEDKLKKRGIQASYTYQRKFRTKKNSNGEFARQIRHSLSSIEYLLLKDEKADQNYNPVVRTRTQFHYNNESYSVDVYSDVLGHDKIYLLRCCETQKNKKDIIPPFIKVIKDVKADRSYSIRFIAKK